MKRVVAAAILVAVQGLVWPAIAEAADQLVISTGSPKGVYTKYATALRDKVVEMAKMRGLTPPEIVIATSNGSLENVTRLGKGEAQLAPVQPDVWYHFKEHGKGAPKLQLLTQLHEEYAYLLCNRAAKITSVDYFEKNNAELITVGSGAAVTWRAWVELDKDYARSKPIFEASPAVALQKVAAGGGAPCLLYVAGLNNDFLKVDAAKLADKVVLTEIDDGDFNDAKDFRGERIYQFTDLPKNTFGKLQPGGVFNNTGPETLKQRAILVADADWLAKNPQIHELIAEALIDLGDIADAIAAGRK